MNLDNLTSLVRWIPTSSRMPPRNTMVIAYRHGGENGPSVRIAMRKHVYGTRDLDEWLDMNGNYWGKSVDGSEITHWMALPEAPECHMEGGV